MVTVTLLVIVAAFILALAVPASSGKVPLWPAVVMLAIALALQVLPIR